MRVTIDVYKDNGKWYTGDTAYSDVDIPLWDEKFKQFVWDNLPAKIGSGFVVVKDIDSTGPGFHYALYRYEELRG